MTLPSATDLDAFVRATLAEDLGAGGDVTSAATIPAGARLRAVMDAREPIVAAGLPIAVRFFRILDPECEIELRVGEGEAVPAGADLMVLTGNARALLSAERSALNTVQHLSGIATLTRRYVDAIDGTGARLLDTRKTIPGLRVLEKYAVRVGGGHNHRHRLDDGLLIKDNHIAVAGGVRAAVRAAIAAGHGLTHGGLMIQVECDSFAQVQDALAAGADRLLLDNMSNDQLRHCVTQIAGRVPTEASGGVRLDTIRAIAETGVTYISVGRITQSAPAVDIGLDFLAV
jgi:nicotinate-nucleotide pyrophosphorylase (carboxylating)